MKEKTFKLLNNKKLSGLGPHSCGGDAASFYHHADLPECGEFHADPAQCIRLYAAFHGNDICDYHWRN